MFRYGLFDGNCISVYDTFRIYTDIEGLRSSVINELL